MGITYEDSISIIKLWNGGMTSREIQEEHFPQYPINKIRYFLSRSPDATRKGKGGRGGGHSRYSPTEDWKVWYLYHNTNMNMREIGFQLGRSKASVQGRMGMLSLIRNKPPSEPTEEYMLWVDSQAPDIIETLKHGVGGVGSGD